MTDVLKLTYDGEFTLVNARSGHWYLNAGEDEVLREWAGWETQRAGVRFDVPVVVEALMRYTGNRPPDCGAPVLAVKHIIDGMVDGGAIPDDNPNWLRAEIYHAPAPGDARTLTVMMKPAPKEYL